MHKTDSLLVEKCRALRKRGFTLGEIIKITKLPKTTVYDHICDIPLPEEVKERIKREATRRINEYIRKYRKGKCMFGRVIAKPKGWTNGLLLLTAHFMFDGEIKHGACVYHNRNLSLIKRIKTLIKKIFKLNPSSQIYNKETGVHRISYFYVELADYFRERIAQLRQYLKRASLKEKRLFLRAFFDDEGCVSYEKKRNLRKVRGYQNDKNILLLIQKLLQEFGIESKIEKGYTYEVVLRGKDNLIKFRNKINFSKRVYINPKRKNSLWRRKWQKRDLLDMAIASYKPIGTPGVHHSKI